MLLRTRGKDGIGGKWIVTANESDVSFARDKNVIKLVAVMVAQLSEYAKNH